MNCVFKMMGFVFINDLNFGVRGGAGGAGPRGVHAVAHRAGGERSAASGAAAGERGGGGRRGGDGRVRDLINDDFLLNNVDFLLKDVDLLLKNVDFVIKQGGCGYFAVLGGAAAASRAGIIYKTAEVCINNDENLH